MPDQIEELSKQFLLPPQGVSDYNFVMGYASDEGWIPGSSQDGHSGTDNALLTYIERYPDDWAIVQKSLGLGRQLGRHACAFIIANKPINEFIPLTTVSDVRVTSFTAPAVEAVGGLKMDFLVVNSLRDIQDCIKLAQHRSPCGIQSEAKIINGRRVPAHRLIQDPKTGDLVDIWDLPEDQDVFKDVAEGRTETVFQFNTNSAIQWLSHFNYKRPDGLKAIKSVEDMAAFTALDRPGPLDVLVSNPEWSGPPDHPDARHNMLVEFARRARGAPGSPDVLKILEDLVPETHGVMCYQEQLQRVYQNLTDCTGSEAEEFRTNVAKKKKEKVDAAYPFFMERAGAKVGTEDAQKLWDFIKTWAQYGFNKSHAVCYAVIGYACAWLKHHYPLEWWCAVLRNASKDEVNDKFWRYCARYVALPDVQLSQENWYIDNDRVRAPVSLLHGVGEKAHEQLCKYAPYSSIDDFAEKLMNHRDSSRQVVKKKKKTKDGDTYVDAVSLGRSAIQRKMVYSLIVAGTMDSLFPESASVDECLYIYDNAVLKAAGAKVEQYEYEPLVKKAWKSAYTSYRNASKTNYQTLDPLGRYQSRKDILPAYGTDLRPIVAATGLPDFLRVYDGKKMRYVWKRWNPDSRSMVETEDPIVSGERLDILNTTTKIPDGGYRCAVLAYVEDRKVFRYENKTKEGMKLTLDVGGAKYETATFWGRDGVLCDEAKSLETGSIIAALLVRTRPEKSFLVRRFDVIRGKLQETKEESEDKESDEKSE